MTTTCPQPPRRFGHFTNPDTGEVYVLMRTYDPVVGTWTTLDLLRFVDGLNMYLAYFVPGGVDQSGFAIELFMPPTPQKCSDLAYWITVNANMGRWINHDAILWEHYMKGSGKEMLLDFKVFDDDKCSAETIMSDAMQTAKNSHGKGLACGESKLISVPVKIGSCKSFTRMINMYSISGTVNVSIKKHCLLGCCVSYSFSAAAELKASDRTDFNANDNFLLLTFGLAGSWEREIHASDALVNACGLGTAFDISGKTSTRTRDTSSC